MLKTTTEKLNPDEKKLFHGLRQIEISDQPEQPFQNNETHLAALEKETRLHLLLAQHSFMKSPAMRISDVGNILGQRDVETKKQDISPAKLRHRLNVVKENRRKRESWSRKKGVQLLFPKVSALYKLDPFEQDVLMLLFVSATFHDFRALLTKSVFRKYVHRSNIEIGAILSILSTDFVEQVRRRSHFSINSRLMENQIVITRSNHMEFQGSILDQSVCVHPRIANFIMGDNNVYDEDMDCIEMVRSNVHMDSIVLPEGMKEAILGQVSSYIERHTRASDLGLFDHFGYGTGMLCLFHGPSGTGKTMLAHGLADHFGMNLLVANMESYSSYNRSLKEIISYVFKEARLTNSIVFFDECDDVFEMDTYGSSLLLVEVEKSDCITILATNNTYKLDPALDRRIQIKIHLDMPGPMDRERIWRSLIPGTVSIEKDVDFQELAHKYLFSGGLIKNAVISAINMAVRDLGPKSDLISLSHSMLQEAAEVQSNNTRQRYHLGKVYKPDRAVDDLNLDHKDKRRLRNLAKCERSMMFSEIDKGILIVTDDIDVAVEALEAVACESDHLLRKFTLTELLAYELDDRLINPITHKPLVPMDLLFLPQNDHRSMTVLVDDSHLFAGNVDNDGNGNEDMEKLMNRLEQSERHIYLITEYKPTTVYPEGISRVIRIGFPSEMVQLQAWKEKFADTDVQKFIDHLVERYPMHPKQIADTCREARIRSLIEHGTENRMGEFVEQVLNDRPKKQPILFGKEAR